MNARALYFVAIIPPSGLRKTVEDIKQEFSKTFHVFHALKSPPHITLIPPFQLGKEPLKPIREKLMKLVSHESKFELSTKGFSSFGSRVIFIDIYKSQALNELYIHVNSVFEHAMDKKPFNPHMTIAFRDLSKEIFEKAWPAYSEKSFSQSFEVDSISLLKHNGKKWEVYEQFPFGPS